MCLCSANIVVDTTLFVAPVEFWRGCDVAAFYRFQDVKTCTFYSRHIGRTHKCLWTSLAHLDRYTNVACKCYDTFCPSDDSCNACFDSQLWAVLGVLHNLPRSYFDTSVWCCSSFCLLNCTLTPFFPCLCSFFCQLDTSKEPPVYFYVSECCKKEMVLCCISVSWHYSWTQISERQDGAKHVFSGAVSNLLCRNMKNFNTGHANDCWIHTNTLMPLTRLTFWYWIPHSCIRHLETFDFGDAVFQHSTGKLHFLKYDWCGTKPFIWRSTALICCWFERILPVEAIFGDNSWHLAGKYIPKLVHSLQQLVLASVCTRSVQQQCTKLPADWGGASKSRILMISTQSYTCQHQGTSYYFAIFWVVQGS